MSPDIEWHPTHGVVCSFTGTYVHCECPSSPAWGEAS